jgi:hypothetical protein
LFVKSAFLTFPSARNGVELEGGEKVKANLNLQKILKSFPIPNKKNTKQKLVVMKDKNEKGDKVGEKIHCVVRKKINKKFKKTMKERKKERENQRLT